MKFIALIVFILSLQGCDKKPTDHSGEPVIAVVNGKTIRSSEFKEYLTLHPIGFEKITKADLQAKLDAMITDEVIITEAERLRLDRSPAIRQQIGKVLQDALIETNVEAPLRSQRITPEEIDAFYEKNHHKIIKNERVRVLSIYLHIDPNLSLKSKKVQKKKAHAILNLAKKEAGSRAGFQRLSHKYSQTSDAFPSGYSSYFDQEDESVPQAIRDASFNMKKAGEVYPDLIEVKGSYYIIMLAGYMGAKAPSREALQRQVKNYIYNQRLQEGRIHYLQDLHKDADIHVDEAILQEMLYQISHDGYQQP